MSECYGGCALGSFPAGNGYGMGGILREAVIMPGPAKKRVFADEDTTQGGGRFSIAGHRAIMKGLLAKKKWDDADAETHAWFRAGMGTPDERARFKPNQPFVLPNGKHNYSFVARYGHQAVVAEPDAASQRLAEAEARHAPVVPAAPVTAGLFGSTSTMLVVLGIGAAILYGISRKGKRHASS